MESNPQYIKNEQNTAHHLPFVKGGSIANNIQPPIGVAVEVTIQFTFVT
jgi:hypothetical protein